VKLMMMVLWVVVTMALHDSGSPGDGEASQPVQKQQHSYEEREVYFRNEPDSITLAGTLTIPDSPRPLAAVILIPNSSTDRDGTAGQHRPLRVLAEHLARSGMIVLRTDSRGIGQSEGRAWPANTKQDIASDVEAAIRYLRQRPDTGPGSIGLIGHSEGASVATIVAARSSEVAFVVMLGGPGLIGSRVLCSQIRRVARAFGVGDSTIDRHVRLIQAATQILREQPDEDLAKAELMKLYDDYLRQTTDAERSALTRSGYATPDSPAEFAAGMLLPWIKDFLLYDPREDLSRVRCPLLSLIGEKDMQVAPEVNNAAILKALEKGGNHHTTVVELPGLNHLLQAARTGSPAEYKQIAETMSPAALEAISEWIFRLPL
jgi:pimeloyl-ACP methyl ester carboxylesterase